MVPVHRARRRRQNLAAGFSLIELLVVVGIIAVLLSLLATSLTMARSMAFRLRCQNNVRGLCMATRLYVSDDPDGRMPYAAWGPGGACDPTAPAAGWLYQYPNFKLSPDDDKGGSLYRYTKDVSLYHCPLHNPPYTPGTTENDTSYLINGAICGFGATSGLGAPLTGASFPLTAWKQPSQDMLFFECGTVGQAINGGYSSGSNFWNDGSSYPGENILTDRHGSGASIGFFDFHVEYFDRNTYNTLLSQSPGPLWCNPRALNGQGGINGINPKS